MHLIELRCLRDFDPYLSPEQLQGFVESVIKSFTCDPLRDAQGQPIGALKPWLTRQLSLGRQQQVKARLRGQSADLPPAITLHDGDPAAPEVSVIIQPTTEEAERPETWSVRLPTLWLETLGGQELIPAFLNHMIARLDPYYAAVEYVHEQGVADVAGGWPDPPRLHWLTWLRDDLADWWGPGVLETTPVHHVEQRHGGWWLELGDQPLDPADPDQARHRVRAEDHLGLDRGDPQGATHELIPVGFFRELEGSPQDGPAIQHALGGPPPEPGLINYLRSGALLVMGMGVAYDVLRPEVDRVIGEQGVLTDGHYVWPSQLAYYVRHHRLVLPPAFIDHARRQSWRIDPDLDTTPLEMPAL